MADVTLKSVKEHVQYILGECKRIGISVDECDEILGQFSDQVQTLVKNHQSAFHERIDAIKKETTSKGKLYMEMAQALGDENIQDTQWKDDESLPDWTARIEKCVGDIRKRHQDRTVQMKDLIESLRYFVGEYDFERQDLKQLPPKDAEPTDLRKETFEHWKQVYKSCEQEKEQLVELLNDQVDEIYAHLDELGLPTAPDADPQYQTYGEHAELWDSSTLRDLEEHADDSYKSFISYGRLEWMKDYAEKLGGEICARKEIITDVYNLLRSLWRLMGKSDDEIEEFVSKWEGVRDDCVEAYTAEYDRMMELRAEHLAVFVKNEQNGILEKWDALFYGQEARDDFAPFYVDKMTEELLESLEQRNEQLAKEMKESQDCLSKITQYKKLVNDKEQLEISAKDPNRYKSVRGDPGKFIREEKLRKRIVAELPQLEDNLVELLPALEEKRGWKFVYEGSFLLDDIEENIRNRPSSKRARPNTVAPPPAKRRKSERLPPNGKVTVPKRNPLAPTPKPANTRNPPPSQVRTRPQKTPSATPTPATITRKPTTRQLRSQVPQTPSLIGKLRR